MSQSTNQATLTVVQQDSIGANIINRTIGPVSYAGTVGEFTVGNLPSSSATSVALPTTLIYQVYLKNLATASSSVSNNISMAWAPGSTGASTTVLNLLPGQVVTFWAAASSSQSGISSLTLTASNPNVPFEIFLGG